MRLFLDTEFSSLVPHNKLISIALVDENEDYFYAELTDTYTLADCSDFVKTDVLPFLRGGQYEMTFSECALKIGAWIEDRNIRCIIASDAPSWDMPHLRRLLAPLWPTNLANGEIFPVSVPFNVEQDLLIEYNYDVHNALHDALVMKKAICDKRQL